jgi:REP element-mobilizing transposase RayT
VCPAPLPPPPELALGALSLYTHGMGYPRGYFLTWHTYGTWLHGDDAGSVDRQHNVFDTPRLGQDPERFARERQLMRHPPYILSRIARQLVDAVMREHCRRRQWDLRALAVRSNHVHVIIAGPSIEPEPIVKQLKEWATRKLRSHGLAGPRQHVWAAHASTIYLYEPGLLDAKVHYVRNMQDGSESGRPDWDVKLGLGEP